MAEFRRKKAENQASTRVREEQLHMGALVLAGLTNHPPGPAVIEARRDGIWKHETSYHVKFLGEDSVQWVSINDIQIYSKKEAEKTAVTSTIGYTKML